MARPENRSDARSLNLTLPAETFNYLVLLATLGKLGRTENEVATHILVREVYAMFERGFHGRAAAREVIGDAADGPYRTRLAIERDVQISDEQHGVARAAGIGPIGVVYGLLPLGAHARPAAAEGPGPAQAAEGRPAGLAVRGVEGAPPRPGRAGALPG